MANKKLPSTKLLNGKRVKGVLYIARGVGSGNFHNVNASGSDGYSGSGSITPNVSNKSRRGDYD